MTVKKTKVLNSSNAFALMYPTIADWIHSYGWIEIGQDEHSHSMVRALNEGGMVWEGKTKYPNLDDLFRDLEKGLLAWMEENG